MNETEIDASPKIVNEQETVAVELSEERWRAWQEQNRIRDQIAARRRRLWFLNLLVLALAALIAWSIAR